MKKFPQESVLSEHAVIYLLLWVYLRGRGSILPDVFTFFPEHFGGWSLFINYGDVIFSNAGPDKQPTAVPYESENN